MPNDLEPERDQTAPNFAIIEDELEPIHARLVQIPTHSEMLRLALGCPAALVVALMLIR